MMMMMTMEVAKCEATKMCVGQSVVTPPATSFFERVPRGPTGMMAHRDEQTRVRFPRPNTAPGEQWHRGHRRDDAPTLVTEVRSYGATMIR